MKQPLYPKDCPPFTLGDIKAAIPKHLFKRNLFTSLKYLVHDLFEVILTAVTVLLIDSYLVGTNFFSVLGIFRILLWITYTCYQGLSLTGLWVLSHEMGHGAFSESQFINDLLGFPLHTVMFVPYFAWAKSHAIHHAKTNHLTLDQVWVPDCRVSEDEQGPERKGVLRNVFELILMSTIGWPLYIGINATGPETKGFVSHFYPGSEIYERFPSWKIHAGNIAIIAWIYVLWAAVIPALGWSLILRLYFAPLVVVFFFLTAITYLQHTDERIPHFDADEWTWLRGALCTVDRTMGSFVDRKLHYIHSHHVCHHIFSTLPCYNAPEATKYIKEVIGDFYVRDERNWFATLWKNYSQCLALFPKVDALSNERVWWWKL